VHPGVQCVTSNPVVLRYALCATGEGTADSSSLEALKVLTLSDARQLAWQYQSEFGGRRRLSFEARDGEAANRYRLVGQLVALD
jgi:hypothetical protein